MSEYWKVYLYFDFVIGLNFHGNCKDSCERFIFFPRARKMSGEANTAIYNLSTQDYNRNLNKTCLANTNETKF